MFSLNAFWLQAGSIAMQPFDGDGLKLMNIFRIEINSLAAAKVESVF